jgi:restriction system protein
MNLNLMNGILKGMLQFWFIGVILLGMVAVKIVLMIAEKKRLAKSGINEIDVMDGKTFEKHLEVFFQKLGYKVERTRYIGDFGADLVVAATGRKIAVQAKRHKGKVGVKAIQEAVASKGYYECEEAMVVTNSFFTNQARTLAVKNNVALWDRKDLVRNLLRIKGSLHSLETNTTDSTDKCFECGALVSPKVRQYCLDHVDRFGGRMFCFEHQRRKKDVVSTAG